MARDTKVDLNEIFAAVSAELGSLLSEIASERHGATLVFNVESDLGDERHFYPGAIRSRIDFGSLVLSRFWDDWLGYGACQGSEDEMTVDIQTSIGRQQLSSARLAMTVTRIDYVTRACFVVALAGFGLQTRLGHIRKVGPRPFVLGFSTFASSGSSAWG
jgi:hypothetical protein